MNFFSAIIVFSGFLLLGLENSYAQSPLFSEMHPRETGVDFVNRITEDDSLNVFKYEYLYNGAGVGIGDFNNDGLPDIYLSGNMTGSRLYLNKGGLTFADITGPSGTKGNGRWATGVCVADVNGDGWVDIYLCHSGKYGQEDQLTNELFINQGLENGIPVFKEMAKAYGLDAPGTQSTQSAFFDYDRDGDLDMFLLNHSNHTYNPFLNTRRIRSTPHHGFGNRLFRNDGKKGEQPRFTDVTISAGIINNALNFGLAVVIADIDRDGWPDIYTTSDYTEKDCFYRNNRNGTFTESLEKSFAHISKYSMGADIGDVDNDGRPDILTLDMLPEGNHRQKMLKGPDEYDQYHLLQDSGYYKQQMRNMLQLNQGIDEKGNIRFSEIGQLAGISNTDWSWAGLLADFDNDGMKDLLITNGYLRDYTDMDFMKYTVADAKFAAAKEGKEEFKTAALVQKMPSNKIPNYIFQNEGNLHFANKTKTWGLTQSAISGAAAIADLDNDGDLDLVICNNNGPVTIYKNNLAHQQYVKVVCKTGMGFAPALGTQLILKSTDGREQYHELYTVRGYQSTVGAEVIFGTSGWGKPDSLVVIWPDGTDTVIGGIRSGQTVLLTEPDNRKQIPGAATYKKETWVTNVTSASGIDFQHHENSFIDFKDEVLLPLMLSRQGPALATADVDGDGNHDIFLGGAIGQPGTLYLQVKEGIFAPSSSQPWIADSSFEDVHAIFLDADGDGDQDLYVVSGGNEYADQSPEYQDRLYINNGRGEFTRNTDALPAMLSSKQIVVAGDMDGDGDPDLFVGGMYVPGMYPLAAPSYLLRNDSKNGVARFTDISKEAGLNLSELGAVTCAAFADINGDNYPELLIGGDWMSVQVLENRRGKFYGSLKTIQEAGAGWWRYMLPGDFDGDGKIDILLGNCGLNTQMKVSKAEPARLIAADIDDNGTLDPLLTYYIQGQSFPSASRDELLEQVTALRKKFVYYKDYADATADQIIPSQKRKRAIQKQCDQMTSGILWNQGTGQFVFKPLPVQAQFSVINGAVFEDIDGDGKAELLTAGNFEAYRVTAGQSDASLGYVFHISGNRQLNAVDPEISGLYLGGDVRKLTFFKNLSGNAFILAARNDGPIQLMRIKK